MAYVLSEGHEVLILCVSGCTVGPCTIQALWRLAFRVDGGSAALA